MKKTMSFFLLFSFLLSGCASPNAIAYRSVSMQEAIAMMETEDNYILLDVRTKAEYASGHVPGALLLPNEEINGEPALLPDKNQRIFIYCRSGNRSKQAARKLADLGYQNIVEFGGINSWPGEITKD